MRNSKDVGPLGRFIVWLVATVAVSGTFLQSLDAMLDHRLDKFALWISGSIFVFILVLVIEKYKGGGVE